MNAMPRTTKYAALDVKPAATTMAWAAAAVLAGKVAVAMRAAGAEIPMQTVKSASFRGKNNRR